MTHDEITRFALIAQTLETESIQLLVDLKVMQLIDATMLMIIAQYLSERMGYSEAREDLKRLINMREKINERRYKDQPTAEIEEMAQEEGTRLQQEQTRENRRST